MADRRFIKNVISTVFTQFAVLLLGMGSSVIIARVLGPEGVGTYAMVSLLISLLVYFSTLGLGQSTVFFLGKRNYSEKEIFNHNIFFFIVLSIITVIVGLVVIFGFSDKLFPSINRNLLFFSLLIVPCQLLFGFMSYIIIGIHDIRRYNAAQMVRSLFSLVGIICVAVFLGLSVKGVLLVDFIVFCVCSLILMVALCRYIGVPSFKIKYHLIKEFLKYGMTIYVGSTLSFIHLRSGMYLINLFMSPSMVGIYTVSLGLSEKISVLSNSIATVLFPKISSESDQSKIREFTPIVLRNTLFLIVLVALLLAVVSPWFITVIYSNSYVGSVRPFQILLVGTVFMAGWSILESDFKGRGKPIWSTLTIAMSAIINIALNVILLPKYGVTGAAFASTVSYTVSFILALIIYCFISGNSIKEVLLPDQNDVELYKNLVTQLKNTVLNRLPLD